MTPPSDQATLPPSGDKEPLPPPDTATMPPRVDGHATLNYPGPGIGDTSGDLLPGYQLLAELGRGGMGVVYKAMQRAAKRTVAIKMILSGGHAGQADRDRFRTEAEAIARLQHPNIVQVYEVGEHNGLPFFSLEFCAGGSLDRRLAGTPLPPRDAARLVQTLAKAMHAAHQQNVVHRDLKPANILLVGNPDTPLSECEPKITDFGLARKIDEAGQTASGAIMGTPSYMAPEQAGGKGTQIGPKVDVYALGAILYELLVGRPPFKASTPLDTILQVVADEPVPVRQLQPQTPADLETICLKCLAKEPGKRYDTALALAEDLGRFLEGKPILGRPVGRLERAAKWVRRHPAIAGLVTAFVVALLGGIVSSTMFGMEAARHAAEADDKGKKLEIALFDARVDRRKATDALALNERVLTGIRVGQAKDALREFDPRRALSFLESCQPETRRWEWNFMRRLCHGSALTLHSDNAIQDAVFSPDGGLIAVLAIGGVTFFDARTGEDLWSHSGRPYMAAFSPDSSRLVVWGDGDDGTSLKILDVHTHKELRRIPIDPPKDDVVQLVFSHDGQSLACLGLEKGGAVWDANTGEKKFPIPVKAETSAILTYTVDGDSLVVFDRETVRFLNPLTGAEQRVQKLPANGRFTNAAFSPDGRRLALASPNDFLESRSVRIMDLDTGKLHPEISMPESTEIGMGSFPFRFSPDGEQLVFQDWKHQAVFRIVDVTTHSLLGSVRLSHDSNQQSVAISPDGQRLALCSPSAIEVWDVRNLTGGVMLRGHTDEIQEVAIVPGGRQLLTIAKVRPPSARVAVPIGWINNGLGFYAFFDVDDGFGGLRSFGRMEGFSIQPIDRIPDLKWGGPAWEVKRWDLDAGFALATMRGRASPLKCAAFSPKADYVAVGAEDNTVSVWDTQTGRTLFSVPRLAGTPTNLAFDPRGNFLAVLVTEKEISRILFLDPTSGRERRAPITPHQHVEGLALSPDGRSVAGVTVEQTRGTFGKPDRIQVWSLETGEERTLVTLPLGQLAISTALAFSPDGGLLAISPSNDPFGDSLANETVILLDTNTGAKRVQLNGHGGARTKVNRLAFSADGERLATANDDNLVQVWDMRTRQVVYSFQNGTAGNKSFQSLSVGNQLAFSPDNAVLVAANTNAVVLSADRVPSRHFLDGAASSPFPLFSPDGRIAVAAGADHDILLFNAFDGTLLRRLLGHQEQISSFVFSDDSKRLLSASSREGALSGNVAAPGVFVWDVDTGKQVASFGNFGEKALGDMAISADGTRVAIGFFIRGEGVGAAGMYEIQAIDLPTGRRQSHFIPDNSRVMFIEDGNVIAVRNAAKKMLRGWSVESGDEVKVVGDPFVDDRRGRQTADGRRVRASGGAFYIQAPPDERERQRLLAQARPDLGWHADAARAAEVNKEWFAAGFHLSRLLLESPSDVELLCRRARAYTAQKRWKEADTDCANAIRLNPNAAEPWATRGLLEYHHGQLEKAQADLAHAAVVAPDDPAVAAVQAFLYFVDTQPEKGSAAEERLMNQLQILQPLSRQKFVLATPLKDALPEAAPAWPASAWTVLEDALTQRLAADAKAVPLLRLRGMMAAAQGKWHTALPDFQEAAKLAPNDVLAWKGVASALYRGVSDLLADLPHACDEVVRLDAKAWEFWCVRGNYEIQQRRNPAAIEDYTKALAIRPDYDLGHRVRGWLYADSNQWDKAVEDFTRSVELTGPMDPKPWDALALAQLGRGDTAAYQKTCAQMVTLFGRTPPRIWAGGVFAAGPLNPWAAPLTLDFADQAVRVSQEGAEATAARCATLPDTETDWQQLVRLTEKSSDELRGKVLCRAGRFEEAIKLLEPIHGAHKPVLSLYVAVAEHRRGQTAKAKKWLEERTKELLAPPQSPPPGSLDPKKLQIDYLPWTDRVEINQLRRELEGLLKDKGP